jgi:hypothetical protein
MEIHPEEGQDLPNSLLEEAKSQLTRAFGRKPGLGSDPEENQEPDSDVSAPDATEQQDSERHQPKENDAIPNPSEGGEPSIIIEDPVKLPKRGGALPMETTDDPSA